MDMTLAELQEMASRQQQQIEAQQQMLANKVSLELDCLQPETKVVRVMWREDCGIGVFFTPSKQRAPFLWLPVFGFESQYMQIIQL